MVQTEDQQKKNALSRISIGQPLHFAESGWTLLVADVGDGVQGAGVAARGQPSRHGGEHRHPPPHLQLHLPSQHVDRAAARLAVFRLGDGLHPTRPASRPQGGGCRTRLGRYPCSHCQVSQEIQETQLSNSFFIITHLVTFYIVHERICLRWICYRRKEPLFIHCGLLFSGDIRL